MSYFRKYYNIVLESVSRDNVEGFFTKERYTIGSNPYTLLPLYNYVVRPSDVSSGLDESKFKFHDSNVRNENGGRKVYNQGFVVNKKFLVERNLSNGKVFYYFIDSDGVRFPGVESYVGLSEIFKKYSKTKVYHEEDLDSYIFNSPLGVSEDQQEKLVKELNLVSFSKKRGVYIVNYENRYIVLSKVNGKVVPFYLSSGLAEKVNVPSGKWYAIAGMGQKGWLVKLGNKRPSGQNIITEQWFVGRLQNIAKKLNDNTILNEDTLSNVMVVSENDIMSDLNQDFKVIVKDSKDIFNIIKRSLELYDNLDVKTDNSIYFLTVAFIYDVGGSISDHIKNIVDASGIDIDSYLKILKSKNWDEKHLEDIKKYLDANKKEIKEVKSRGHNQIIKEITDYLLNEKIKKNITSDFEIIFKMNQKECVLNVDSKKANNDYDLKNNVIKMKNIDISYLNEIAFLIYNKIK